MTDAVDFLIGFVTFSGDQNHIFRAGALHSIPDGLRTVKDRLDPGFSIILHSSQHIIDDLLRILSSGIVTGDDRLVAVFRRNPGHHRPFAAVPVSTTAHDTTDGAGSKITDGG